MTNKNLEVFKELFGFNKKNDIKKFVKNFTIDPNDFAFLTLTSHKIGYYHKIHYRTIVDNNLAIKLSDLAPLKDMKDGVPANGKALKVFKKIKQHYETRRMLVGHIFINFSLDKWHFFYFDQRDYSIENNHWKNGAHIHFINYLWTNYTLKTLWEQFLNGNPNINGSYHIKWDETSI